MASPLNNLLREPLLHFLLLGAAIFAAYSMFSRPDRSDSGRIVITQGDLTSMREGFINTWQRPPTSEEFDGLIRERVRQEVYYREALALGLDKDDIIIRRRLQQKMEFIGNDLTSQANPTEAELSKYLQEHPELFQVETHFNFHQIYLNPEQRGKAIKEDVTKMIAELNQSNAKPNLQKMGDATMLPSEVLSESETEVIGQFGKDFASKLTQLPIGRWVGPVESVYGVHIVLLIERIAGGTPQLAKVHDKVLREFENSRLTAANEKFYQNLLKNYSVIIERADSVPVKK